MRQHDAGKLYLNGDGDAPPFHAVVADRQKPHRGHGRHGHHQHVHDAEQMPRPVDQREQEPHRTQCRGDVVPVEIRAAEISAGDVVVIEQPADQRNHRRQANERPTDASFRGFGFTQRRRKQLPYRQRGGDDHNRLLAEDRKREGKLAHPETALDSQSDAPQGEGRRRNVGMGE